MIQAQAGHVDANSYVDVAYADSFFNSSIGNDSWPASLELKEAALIEATRILDSQFAWIGDIATPEQSLRWPRLNVYDVDGRIVDSASIPKLLKDATCNLAYYLLQNGGLNQSASGLKGLKVGPIDMKFNDNKTVIGVPKFVVMNLKSIGQFQGYVDGSIYAVNAIRV